MKTEKYVERSAVFFKLKNILLVAEVRIVDNVIAVRGLLWLKFKAISSAFNWAIS